MLLRVLIKTKYYTHEIILKIKFTSNKHKNRIFKCTEIYCIWQVYYGYIVIFWATLDNYMNYRYTSYIIFDNILFFQIDYIIKCWMFTQCILYILKGYENIWILLNIVSHWVTCRYMPQTYRLKFILPSFKKTNYFGHGFFFFI